MGFGSSALPEITILNSWFKGVLTKTQQLAKRTFDISLSLGGLLIVWPLIAVAILISRWDTGASGLFKQERIGRYGKSFNIYKIRTMVPNTGSTVTALHDKRITRMGRHMRRLKIDETPQLYNILVGDMSFVGPRPDVPGYADRLIGDQRRLLELRPGITGPATLAFRNEEQLLSTRVNPVEYNNQVIWPEKTRINLHYLESWSMRQDVKIIVDTVFNG